MKVIHFIEFFPDIIIHTRHFEFEKSTKEIEQSETRP